MSLHYSQAWSVPRPYLYTLVTTVQAAGSDTVVDSVNTSVGLREVQFTSDEGMFLNEQVCVVNHQDICLWQVLDANLPLSYFFNST